MPSYEFLMHLGVAKGTNKILYMHDDAVLAIVGCSTSGAVRLA